MLRVPVLSPEPKPAFPGQPKPIPSALGASPLFPFAYVPGNCGFGSILKLTQARPSADDGTLSLFFLGDAVHAAFDNVSFWSRDEVVFVEDAGDTLHAQRNALDSAWLFDVRKDYSKGAEPKRIIAEGRDPSATLDSAFGAFDGFQNEGDNEITGFHVSNGDASEGGILGAQNPTPFSRGWRAFYTQQHGENFTWELVRKPGTDERDR